MIYTNCTFRSGQSKKVYLCNKQYKLSFKTFIKKKSCHEGNGINRNQANGDDGSSNA